MTRVRLLQIASVAVFFALIAWMTVAGIRLRHWTWDQTVTIRYAADMQNAWNWGSRAARDGYFPLYDRVIAETPDKQYGLDYVPLRLGVMMLWARWAYGTFPGINGWGPQYALNAPLLRLNAAMEFAAAVGMFFLVRQWVRKERQPRKKSERFRWIARLPLVRGFMRDSNDSAVARTSGPWKIGSEENAADRNCNIASTDQRSVPQTAILPNGTNPPAYANSETIHQTVVRLESSSVASSLPVNKRDPSTVDPSAIRFFEGNWIALLAAALVWFNFSSIFSAHARPTWDVWVIPFYIWAIFFAGRNNWFTAGVLIGVGAMLKGQQLVIAPFFLLWPLFSLRFGAMLRWLIGLALAAGLIVSPWQVWLTPKRGPLLLCIAGVLIGPTIWMAMRMIPFTRRWTTPRRPTGRVGSAVARMLPFTRRFFTPDRILAPVVAGDPILSTNESPNATSFEPDPAPSIVRQVISAVFDFARARWPIWISAFCLAAALWLSPVLFATSTAWLKIGFIYGVDKMPSLETGSPASFAAILQHHFDWNSDDVVSLPFTKWTPTMKSLLAMIGYVLIAISAAAAAWHARNHDRRFLLAVAAPWLVYFTIFPEMHERYLLWASLMTAAAVAVNVGLTGLNLLLTAFSWSMAIDQLLRDGKPRGFGIGISRTFGRSLTRFTHSIIPDSGWAILVICVIWLWMMFSTPKRRRKPKPVLLADRSAV